MPRYISMILVLIIGLGIGSLIPAATSWLSDRNPKGESLNNNKAAISPNYTEKEINTFHFGFEKGVLSVIEGKPGESGRVIVSGLNVDSWPKEMLEMAPKVVFYSLDEIQSFIDTVNEPLWQE